MARPGLSFSSQFCIVIYDTLEVPIQCLHRAAATPLGAGVRQEEERQGVLRDPNYSSSDRELNSRQGALEQASDPPRPARIRFDFAA